MRESWQSSSPTGEGSSQVLDTCVWKTEAKTLADRLDVGRETKKGAKANSKIMSPRMWKGAAATGMGWLWEDMLQGSQESCLSHGVSARCQRC